MYISSTYLTFSGADFNALMRKELILIHVSGTHFGLFCAKIGVSFLSIMNLWHVLHQLLATGGFKILGLIACPGRCHKHVRPVLIFFALKLFLKGG